MKGLNRLLRVRVFDTDTDRDKKDARKIKIGRLSCFVVNWAQTRMAACSGAKIR